MVDTLARDVPPEFRDGIILIEVSPKAVPDPVRGGVYTLGECIPLEWSGNGANLQSRIVLYYGSFAALARPHAGEAQWRKEVWDTLTHELRHHLEWRADVGALEAYDWAAEQNFARGEGQPFDPVFFRSGERLAPEIYKVDDDVFIEGKGDRGRGRGDGLEVTWHGRRYRVPMPPGARPPLFVTLDGLLAPPAGDVVVVVLRRPSLMDLWRRRPVVAQRVAMVQPLDA